MVAKRPHHRMDVVGHDRPRMKLVALVFKVTQRLCDEIGDFGAAEPVLAGGAVEQRIHLGGIPVGMRRREEPDWPVWATTGKLPAL